MISTPQMSLNSQDQRTRGKNSFNRQKRMGCPYNDEVIGQDKKNSKSNSKGTVCKYGLHT